MKAGLRSVLLATSAALVLGATGVSAETLTRKNGAPVGDNLNSQTAGPNGPVLLQDTDLIEKLSAFDRERIPERVVHARGVAAKGVFTATADLSDITRADPFEEVGKETPVLLRFSSVINSKGSPETLRDPRGFAVKWYTDEGNWDLVGNNFPIFFIRDAKQFPDMVHSLKPDPITNLREMDASGIHAFKFVNTSCDVTYVKFTWQSRQGNRGLTPEEAAEIQATNFNHHTEDLYQNISAGNYPVWDLMIQTLEPDQLDDFDFNPLDTTKIWPEELVPSRKVGEPFWRAKWNNRLC